MSRASSQLHAHAARYTLRARALLALWLPTTPCAALPWAFPCPPTPNPNACRTALTALDLPRQIEELEKKLETERRYAPPPCGAPCVRAGSRRVAQIPQPHPAPARHPTTPPPHPIPPHPTLTSALRVLRRKRQEIETQLTEIQAVVKQAAAK